MISQGGSSFEFVNSLGMEIDGLDELYINDAGDAEEDSER